MKMRSKRCNIKGQKLVINFCPFYMLYVYGYIMCHHEYSNHNQEKGQTKVNEFREMSLSSEIRNLNRVNENEQLIYNLLKERGILRRVEIESELGLKKSQTIDLIKHLRLLNIVARRI